MRNTKVSGYYSMVKTSLLSKLLIWRTKHISDYQFTIFLSILIGLLSGLAAVIIKNLVHTLQSFLTDGVTKEYHNYYYFIFPALGILATVLIIRYLIKRDVGHGIPKILYAISKENGKIRRHNLFSSIITSVLTVGFGGSVGLEGPTVATGGAIGSNLGRLFHLDYKRITLLIVCASAAAMSAIFKAPIASIVFVLEVIMFDLTMSSIVPILIASATATLTSYLFLGMQVIYPFEVNEQFVINDLPYYILLGILAGFVSLYFTKIYRRISERFDKIRHWHIKFLIGSTILGALIFFFPSLYGEGYESINMSLQGEHDYLFNNTLYFEYKNHFIVIFAVFVLVLMLKVIATALTFAAGGIGGIFAPTLFLGATLGLFFSKFMQHAGIDLTHSNFALVGMAGMISGVIHAPLTAIFLIAELTGGYELFMPLMITSTLAFGTIRIFERNSVYTYLLAKRGELMTHDKDKRVLMMMRINKVIENDFVKVDPQATLGDLVQAITKSNRNIFPVVDAQEKMHGIVKLDHIRDIMFNHEKYDRIKVKDLMTMPEFIIQPEDTMEEVVRKFQRSNRYTIPVLKDGRYYQGFISRAKLFSAYRKMLRDFSED